MNNHRVLILGASGMLGHTLFIRFSSIPNFEVHATVRKNDDLSSLISDQLLSRVHSAVDANEFNSVRRVLSDVRPSIVINCIGVIKQSPTASDPIVAISMNSLFPHQLALACASVGARLIHISTDCIFSGKRGGYTEQDPSDADDLYGRTKFLGEVIYPHCITLRTSIIGHELKGHRGLIDWFVSQQGTVRGFTNAIYTGFPTVEMARIISDHVIPIPGLSGLYHVSSEPISKHDLLTLTARIYGKEISIVPYGDFHCNRSLDSIRFRQATGYRPPSWPEMITAMQKDYESKPYYIQF